MKKNSFSALVKGGMAGKGLTLRELCRRVSLDPSFFSKVLSGKRSPPAEEKVLRRIASALDLPATEVVVAAGRIPSEWSSICEDRGVFEMVQRILGKRGQIYFSDRGSKPRRDREIQFSDRPKPVDRPEPLKNRSVPFFKKDDFAEELL